jgi:hypothetical protein
MPGNEATDIYYLGEIHVNIILLPLQMLCNIGATKIIMMGLPAMTCVWIWWKSMRKECKLSRSSMSSPSQFALCRPVCTRPLMILVFRASTNCPTIQLLLNTTVQMNNTKCVLKGILMQALGLKTVKTCPFQRFPHMLDSTNINKPPILDGVGFLKAGLPF